MKTVDELVNKMLELFPDGIVEEDDNGELIIYTAMKADESDNLVEMDEEN